MDAAFKGWLERDAYTLSEEFETDTRQNVLILEPGRPPEPEWGVLIGECVHNIRSALDQIVYAGAWRNTNGPISRKVAQDSEFPVFGSRPPTASEMRRRIGALHPDAQTIIQGLQPYKRLDAFASDDLWILDQFWNLDKHRRIPVTLLAIKGLGIGRPGENFYIETFEWLGARPPMKGKTKLARYIVRGNVNVKRIPEFHVAFGIGTPAYGAPVIPTLTRLRSYAEEQVLAPLARFL